MERITLEIVVNAITEIYLQTGKEPSVKDIANHLSCSLVSVYKIINKKIFGILLILINQVKLLIIVRANGI